MPSPDTRYVLDGAWEMVLIGSDTHEYMMQRPDADAVVDAFEMTPQAHVDGLRRVREWPLGAYLETLYVDWRAATPLRPRQEVSALSLLGLRRQWLDIVQSSTRRLAKSPTRQLNGETASRFLRVVGHDRAHARLLRTLARCRSDLDAATPGEVQSLVDAAGEREHARLVAAALAYRAACAAPARVRERRIELKQRRAATKRSVRLLASVTGEEPTRIFMSREALVFEGVHADYRLTMQGEGGHGAVKLEVISKHGVALCSLCLYTDEVPAADHAASIALHIRSGCEEELVRIGNATVLSPLAHEEAWLRPYLPQPFDSEMFQRLQALDPEPTPERLTEATQAVADAISRQMRPHLAFLERSMELRAPEDVGMTNEELAAIGWTARPGGSCEEGREG